MSKKRKLTKNEEIKESKALDILHSCMYEMSPHQLDLLSEFALNILYGKKVQR